MGGQRGAGDNENLIENGRLHALDDPAIRKLCSRYGDPDLWLDESWNAAVPGIDMRGDCWQHCAQDPLHWVKTELEVCRHHHPMFMSMVGADDKYCQGEGARWWKGGCREHNGVQASVRDGNCCEGGAAPAAPAADQPGCCHRRQRLPGSLHNQAAVPVAKLGRVYIAGVPQEPLMPLPAVFCSVSFVSGRQGARACRGAPGRRPRERDVMAGASLVDNRP